MRLIALLFLISGLCLLNGCAHKPEDKRLTEQQYYETAQKAMRNDNYLVVIEQLEQLQSRFPFGRYANQVDLDLIYAYYRNLDFAAAQDQAERFIRLHPDHNNVDYAYYLRGLAHLTANHGIFDRFLPTHPSERDLTEAKQAFADFNYLVSHYPNSLYAEDAHQRMIYLRNLMAEHELQVARYYLHRHAYLSAENRAQYVVENYQGAPVIPDALAMMVEAYRALHIDDLAQQTEQWLKESFPNYAGLDQQGHLKKFMANNERSWLNIISFGLLSNPNH